MYLSALSTEDPRSLQRIRNSGERVVSCDHNVTAVKVKLLTNSNVLLSLVQRGGELKMAL
jgi:hypothetical protein